MGAGAHERDLDTRIGVRQIDGAVPLTKGLSHHRIRDRQVLAEIPHHKLCVAHQTDCYTCPKRSSSDRNYS